MRERLCTLLIALIFVAGNTWAAEIFYVKTGGNDSNSGKTWADALGSLQIAIDKAYLHKNANPSDDVEVWVAAGTYIPQEIKNNTNVISGSASTITASSGGVTARDYAFVLRPNVKIYGGFPANADDLSNSVLSSRDWEANVTILSGDRNDNDDGNATNYLDNCYHVVVSVDAVGVACLDGFVVTGGYGTDTGSSTITINGRALRRRSGAGVFVFYSAPTLNNLDIVQNTSPGYGGGVCIEGAPSVNFSNSKVRNNTSAIEGGGIYINSSTLVTLTNIDINNNSTIGSGGGIHITNSSPVISNTTITGNAATSNGGGIYNATSSSPLLTNVTISGNRASNGGGIRNSNSSPALRNTIVWGNSTGVTGTGTPTYDNCVIQGGTFAPGSGNYSTDPMFAAPVSYTLAPFAGGNYRLIEGSFAIDEGDNTWWDTPIIGLGNQELWRFLNFGSLADAQANATDIVGAQRFQNGVINMGAYEETAPAYYRFYVSESIGINNPLNEASEAWKGWDYACTDLQKVIDEAHRFVRGNDSIAEVWVSKGTYTPQELKNNDGTTPTGLIVNDNAFVLRPNVQVFGGFPANLSNTDNDNFNIRNWLSNKTILNGDLNNNGNDANDACHVVVSVGEVGAACLDGFDITGGYSTDGTTSSINLNDKSLRRRSGAGVFAFYSAPTLNNLDIYQNTAPGYGGGLCMENDPSPKLTNATVRDNTSGMGGGGISVFYCTSVVIANVTFTDNLSNSSSGGGIYANSSLTLTDVTIVNNTATSNGGGMYNTGPSSTLANVIISGNKAANGGGMYNTSSSPVLINTLISGNMATSNGGGIYNTSSSSPVMTNVTISGNEATTSGGGMYNNSSYPKLYNGIVLGNNSGITNHNSIDCFHSLVQGEAADASKGNLDGSIAVSDVFVSPLATPGLSAGGDFRLKSGSAPIDAGNKDYWDVSSYAIAVLGNETLLKYLTNDVWQNATDLIGNARIAGMAIDFGAYESQPLPAVITVQPQGADVCLGDNVTLSAVATGTSLSYQWYKDGVAIPGATGQNYTITNAQPSHIGSYTIVVTAAFAGGPVTSNIAVVTVSTPPQIETDLSDEISFSTTVGRLSIEATGNNLTYQWYHDGYAIAGAVADYIIIRDNGNYHVVVSNPCGSVVSNRISVTFTYVIPIINRMVILSQAVGVETNPNAGIHYVRSRTDFVFEMWLLEGYSLNNITVTTDRGNEVSLSPTLSQGEGQGGASSLRVTVKHINASTTIYINGVGPVGNESLTSKARIWSYSGSVYFSLPEPTEVSIFTLSGVLYDRRYLPAGDTSLPLPPGVYIISIPGMTEKLTIKN